MEFLARTHKLFVCLSKCLAMKKKWRFLTSDEIDMNGQIYVPTILTQRKKKNTVPSALKAGIGPESVRTLCRTNESLANARSKSPNSLYFSQKTSHYTNYANRLSFNRKQSESKFGYR